MDVFGWKIMRKQAQAAQQSVVPPPADDGAMIVVSNSNPMVGQYGIAVDLDGSIKTDLDLIKRYREIAQYAPCDMAIEDIVNDAIVDDPNTKQVSIILDELPFKDNIKEIFRQEFDRILKLYEFEEKGHDIFRQWYIDGRIAFQIILDPQNPEVGIQELRYIDPRKIRKVKDIKKERDPLTGTEVVVSMDEYFLYNDAGFNETSKIGVRLPVDTVVFVTSGLVDSTNNLIISHLQKAIRPVNQLKMMEDALVIYRISRAPERRVFYIDVNNIPKHRAEQYVTDMMNKFRNKVVYDVKTGEVKDQKLHLSMMEDIWIPRRGDKTTTVDVLPGGQNLNQIEDVQFFENKLFQAMNVPLGRLKPDQSFSIGRSDTVSREEIKFNKFIGRLRKRFAKIFRDALRIQLIAKKVISPDDWDQINDFVRFDFQKDNFFSEMKSSEIINQRLATLQAADPFVGKYFSYNWVKKNILQQSEDDIAEMEKEMQVDLEMQVAYAEHEGQMEIARQMPMIQVQAEMAAQAAKGAE